MDSDYLTDEEYRTYWFRLSGLREKVAEDIEFQNGMKIIDVGTGWGLFALEMARKINKCVRALTPLDVCSWSQYISLRLSKEYALQV